MPARLPGQSRRYWYQPHQLAVPNHPGQQAEARPALPSLVIRAPGRPPGWEGQLESFAPISEKSKVTILIRVKIAQVRYSRRCRLRVGWRSLRKAFASIWRMRSRVTLK